MDGKVRYDPQIHNRRSMQLDGYDYSQAALYFITICCHNRQCLFGKVEDGDMRLNEAGKVVNQCWEQIPEHFNKTFLHEYVIMPNHVHGIIELLQDDIKIPRERNVQPYFPQDSNQPVHQFQKMIPGSIAAIVKGFKIGVTTWFRNNTEIQVAWQRGYHDHIIRNEQSYKNIANYIMNNPVVWQRDKFYEVGRG